MERALTGFRESCGRAVDGTKVSTVEGRELGIAATWKNLKWPREAEKQELRVTLPNSLRSVFVKEAGAGIMTHGDCDED